MTIALALGCLILLTVLFIKHLAVDFFWQPPYEWQNKGTYLHPGGIRHSAKHALVTFVILFFVLGAAAWALSFILACIEFLIHYHTDWFKMWICKKKGWGVDNPKFWMALGVDQFIHSMSYILLVLILVVIL